MVKRKRFFEKFHFPLQPNTRVWGKMISGNHFPPEIIFPQNKRTLCHLCFSFLSPSTLSLSLFLLFLILSFLDQGGVSFLLFRCGREHYSNCFSILLKKKIDFLSSSSSLFFFFLFIYFFK